MDVDTTLKFQLPQVMQVPQGPLTLREILELMVEFRAAKVAFHGVSVELDASAFDTRVVAPPEPTPIQIGINSIAADPEPTHEQILFASASGPYPMPPGGE